MTEADRDLQTLIDLGPIVLDDFVIATPAVRLDMLFEGPLSERKGKLDPLFAQALSLMEPELTVYGGEGPFAQSTGRKPKPSDMDQLGRLSEILAGAEAESAAENAEQMAYLRGEGLEPDPANFKARDHGALLVSDAFPLNLSGTHLQMIASAEWRVSLSFSLSLYQQKKPEILALCEAIFASGVAETGNFGFAYNFGTAAAVEQDARKELRPRTQRFQMLNMIEACAVQYSDVFEDKKGLYPMGSWTYHDKAMLAKYRIKEDQLTGLEGTVHAVREAEHGVLAKLTAEPTLGDLNHQADLAPAFALGQVMARAMEKAELNSLSGLRIGGQADRWAHYMRFARS